MIGKHHGNAYAYAWADTFKNQGVLTITPINSGKVITLDKIVASLQGITGSDSVSLEELNGALRVHMNELAEEKLAVRTNWLVRHRRKYGTSHYASIDAALIAMPNYPEENLAGQLSYARAGMQYDATHYQHSQHTHTVSQSLPSSAPVRKSRVTGKELWDAYTEPSYFVDFLRASAGGCCLRDIDERPYLGIGKGVMGNRPQNTPNERVTVLFECLKSYPTKMMSHTGYNTGIKNWIAANPVGIKVECERVLDWVKLDPERREELTVQHLHWLNKYHSMQLYAMSNRNPKNYIFPTYAIMEDGLVEVGTENLFDWCEENIGEYDPSQRPQRPKRS